MSGKCIITRQSVINIASSIKNTVTNFITGETGIVYKENKSFKIYTPTDAPAGFSSLCNGILKRLRGVVELDLLQAIIRILDTNIDQTKFSLLDKRTKIIESLEELLGVDKVKALTKFSLDSIESLTKFKNELQILYEEIENLNVGSDKDKSDKKKKLLKRINELNKGVAILAKSRNLKEYIQKSDLFKRGLKLLTESGAYDQEPVESENTTDEENKPERKIEKRLKEAFHQVFLTTPSPMVLCRNLFRESVFGMTVIGNESIIRNNDDLNKAILNEKNKFYKTLLDYMKSKFPEDIFAETMFEEDGTLNGLLALYNYITTIRRFLELLPVTDPNNFVNGVLDTDNEDIIRMLMSIRRGYSDYLQKKTGTDDYKFYMALNAYMSLYYFDELLSETTNIINIDPYVGKNIEVDRSYNKYTFNRKPNELAKGWATVEHEDAMKTSGKFSKLIIEHIKYIDYKTKKEQAFNLNPTLFTAAITNLFGAALKAKSLGLTSSEGNIERDVLLFLANLHDDVSGTLENIFEALFSKGGSGYSTLISDLKTKGGLSDYDLNVLYSIYVFLFKGRNGQKSLVDIEYDTFYGNDKDESFTQGEYPISECLFGFIDRLMQANYLETYVDQTGYTQVRVKKKFSTRKREMDLRNGLNQNLRTKTPELRERAQSLYNFHRVGRGYRFTMDLDDGVATYEIVPGSESNNIFEGNDNVIKLQRIVIKNGEEKAESILSGENITLSSENINNIFALNTLLSKMLMFIEENLGVNLRTRESLERLLVAQTLDSNIILHMFKTAARFGCINSLYVEASEKNITPFLHIVQTFPELAPSDSKPKNGIWDRVVDETNPDLKGIRFYDTWVDAFAQADAIIDGSSNKSTTKNTFGDNIGNFSTAFLGGNITYYLNQALKRFNPTVGKFEDRPESVQGHLLFSKNMSLISGIAINLDANSRGTKKLVKKMNTAELLHQSIFSNFYGSYFGPNSKGSIIVLPTTYSDKTKIIQYIINARNAIGVSASGLSSSDISQSLFDLSTDELVEVFVNTIGLFYKQAYRNTLEKYIKIFNIGIDRFEQDILDIYAATKAVSPNLDQVSFILDRVDTEKILKIVLEEINNINNNTNITNKLDYITSEAQRLGLELFTHSDYRVEKNGNIRFNELLDYYANFLFTNKDNLKARLKEESIKFVNDIIKSNLIFYLKYSDDSDTSVMLTIEQMFPSTAYDEKEHTNPLFNGLGLQEGDNIRTKYLRKWTIGNKLILARSGTKIYTYGDLIPSDDPNVEINPLLEKYFYTDTLLSNNLRLSLTGTELAHPSKKHFSSIDISSSFEDRQAYFENNKKLFELVESEVQMVQLKRNVIVPATLLYMTLHTLRGIPSVNNIAIIKDPSGKVFNYSGETKGLDGNDGAGRCNSLISILENFSLLDQRVGTVKKTIMHAPLYGTGGVFLGKWAIFPTTNKQMNNGIGNSSDDYELNKAMLNLLWYEIGEDGKIDLNRLIDKSRMAKYTKDKTGKLLYDGIIEIDLTSVRGQSGVRGLKFERDILKGRDLYRRKLTFLGTYQYFLIIDFGKNDDGIYYTNEDMIKTDLLPSLHPNNVYHLFNSLSDHIELSEDDIKNIKLEKLGHGYFRVLEDFGNTFKAGEVIHTINSNFELVEAMGGLDSVEVNDDNKFVTSESSNYAAVEFINALSYINERDSVKNTRRLNSNMYYQPLKDCMIHYAVNNTAVKNGAGNINEDDAWKNPQKGLKYIRILYDGIGVQQDTDHDVTESLLTEFSQVIASLDALGNIHGIAKNIYNSLRQIALLSSSSELNAFKTFLNLTFDRSVPKERMVSDLYDIIARVVIESFKNNNEGNLADEILSKVKAYFNNNLDHFLDEFKIPFSDPGVFKSILPTFVGEINAKAIKRKYPGSGMVLCPSFNFVQIYEINGYTYLFNDLFEEIQGRKDIIGKGLYKRRRFESTLNYKKRVVEEYLKLKQLEIIEKADALGRNTRDYFHPTENVLIRVLKKDSLGNLMFKEDGITPDIAEFNISLDDIDNYTIFTEDYWYILIPDYLNYDLSTAKFYLSITKPRNLAPAKTTWEEEVSPGVWVARNAFMEDSVRKGFTSKVEYEVTTTNELGIPITTTKEIIIPNTADAEKILNLIYKNASSINIKEVTKRESKNSEILDMFRQVKNRVIERTLPDGTKVQHNIRNIEDKASEIIMSSLYSKIFPDHHNLASILQNSDLLNITPRIEIAGQKDYHITLGKHNGRHSFITFNKIEPDDDVTRISPYTHIKPREIEIKGKKFLLIYALDKKSQYTYPIGYLELVEGLKFNEETRQIEKDGEEFVDKQNKYRIGKNNEVYVEHIFVKKYDVTLMVPLKVKGLTRPSTHRLFEIDYKEIELFFGTENNIHLNIINNILSYLYESEEAEDLRVSLDSRFWDKSEIDKTTLATIIHRTLFQDTVIEQTKGNIKDLLEGTSIIWLLNKEDKARIAELRKYLDSLELEKLLNLTDDLVAIIKNLILDFRKILGENKKYIYLHGKFSEDLLNKLFSKVTTLNTFQTHKENIIREFTDLLMNEKLISEVFLHYKIKNSHIKSSFERSLDMICSRIPAQSLQSFMKCKVSGFIPGTDNYVYVSHWQLYLLGSDYDIDKSYIMGSAIDRNGIYVGWSPLFEYNTIETLRASEELPFPTLNEITIGDDGVDMTEELLEFATSLARSVERVKSFVHALNKLLDSDKTSIKVNNNDSRFKRLFALDFYNILAIGDVDEKTRKLVSFYLSHFIDYSKITLTDEEQKLIEESVNNSSTTPEEKEKELKVARNKAILQKALDISTKAIELFMKDPTDLDLKVDELVNYRLNKRLNEFKNNLTRHNRYKPSDEIREQSIKNNISSKIGMVVLDLVNRVHSYTPVDMKDIRPDEDTSNPMSLLNSSTKFIMQVQNMVGKDVIGISAVGMKIFYNLTYYFNEEIRQGRTKHLLFSRTFDRILNRYKESKNGDLQKKIKEARDVANDAIYNLVYPLINDDDLYLNSIYYQRLLNDVEIIESDVSTPKEEKKNNTSEDNTSKETPKRKTIDDKETELREKLSKKELSEENILFARDFLELKEQYDKEVKRNKEYDEAKRKSRKKPKKGEKASPLELSDKTEQRRILQELNKIYAKITNVKLSSERGKVTLGSKIEKLKAILDQLSEDQREILELVESLYQKLKKGATNRKIKFISKNIIKLANQVYTELKIEGSIQTEEEAEKLAELIGRNIKNGSSYTLILRELYYAFRINKIKQELSNKIRGMRLANDGLRSKTVDKLANVNFSIENVLLLRDSFNHIKKISEDIRSKNPSITDEELVKLVCKKLNQEQDDADKADIFISELLSAATDNAKELILAQINAGSDLAGYYLYLLSLGFNIKDIVAFMTSPVIQSLHDLSQTNMFTDLIPELTVDNVISILRGDLKSLNLTEDLSRSFHNRVGSKEEEFLSYIEARIDGSETEPITSFMHGAQADFLENVVQTIKRNLNGQVFSDYLLDLKELIKLKPLVKEHSSLGNTLLGMNQGLPTSEEDLLSKLGAIHRIVKNREKEFGINEYLIKSIDKDLSGEKLNIKQIILDLSGNEDIFDITENLTDELLALKDKIEKVKNTESFLSVVYKLTENNPKLKKEYIEMELLKGLLIQYDGKSIAVNFNVREWLINPNYLKKVREYYNIIKGTWNVFDVIYRLPLYRGIFELFRLTYGVNHEMSIKARLIDKIHQELLNENTFLDDYSLRQIEEYVDDKLIYKFITTKLSDWTFRIPPEAGFLTTERFVEYSPVDKIVKLDNVTGIANFKRFMEEYIIPKLKDGSLTRVEILDGLFVDTGEQINTDVRGKSNQFIARLLSYINEGEITAYKIDGIDMMNIDSSDNTRLKYQEVVDDFTELRRIDYAGHSLADWFMLYNLIINKNKYGSDRMTSVFRSFIQGIQGDNLYKTYYQYIGDVDYKYKSTESMDLFDIDRLDIDLYLAKFVPEYLEKSAKDKYIKLIKNGRVIYKRRTKSGDYVELPLGIDRTLYLHMNNTENAKKYRNSKLYYPRPNPNYENKEYFKGLLNSQNVLDIFKGLVMLEANSVIKINIVC